MPYVNLKNGKKIIIPFYLSYHLTFCTKITTVKNSTWCHYFLIDRRENLKVHFFSGWPYRPRFKGIYAEAMSPKSSVSNILELLLTGLTSNPHFKQCAQQSRLCLLFAAIYLIYTKRINPQFSTESECNHIYTCVYLEIYMCPLVLCVCSFQTFNLDLISE